MRPKLSICKYDLGNQYFILGLPELLTTLIESNVFDITYHNDRINATKGDRGSVLYYNDKKIYLDVWDYACPTHSPQVWDANFDLIIKLQHAFLTPEEYDARCQTKHQLFIDKSPEQRKMFWNRIVPWTFFCSRIMKQFIGKEDEITSEPINQLAFFCGKHWRCRHGISESLKRNGIEYIISDQGCYESGRPLSDEEYIKKMKSCQLGLVLHGRSSAFSQSLNRREIDYMMLKKPLLLNYKPYYYNGLIEGKHYIYFNEKSTLKDLLMMYNVEEIGRNGYEWYKANASNKGVVNTFLQILREKLNETI